MQHLPEFVFVAGILLFLLALTAVVGLFGKARYSYVLTIPSIVPTIRFLELDRAKMSEFREDERTGSCLLILKVADVAEFHVKEYPRSFTTGDLGVELENVYLELVGNRSDDNKSLWRLVSWRDTRASLDM